METNPLSEHTVAIEPVRKHVGPLWTSAILSVEQCHRKVWEMKAFFKVENSLWSSSKRTIILQMHLKINVPLSKQLTQKNYYQA